MITPGVIQIRQSLCRGRCKANPLDPCAVCENGHWGRYEQRGCNDGTQTIGPGDKLERLLNKIPGVSKLPCHDQQTKQLKPESPCGKAKARLNAGQPIIPTLIKRLKGE